jgi:hypothetical protein
MDAVSAGPLARPHLAETPLDHPMLAQGTAMATEDTRSRQSSTDHLLTRHLAASTVSTQQIDSPSQLRSSVTVHAALSTST